MSEGRMQLFVRFYDFLQDEPAFKPEDGQTDFNRLNKASLRVLNNLAAEIERLRRRVVQLEEVVLYGEGDERTCSICYCRWGDGRRQHFSDCPIGATLEEA